MLPLLPPPITPFFRAQLPLVSPRATVLKTLFARRMLSHFQHVVSFHAEALRPAFHVARFASSSRSPSQALAVVGVSATIPLRKWLEARRLRAVD